MDAVVADAMLAPSAHNTQPARWSLDDGGIRVSADLSRRLPVGDPTDRDLLVACGAAVEGTVLALAMRGFGTEVALTAEPDHNGFRPIADVRPTRGPKPGDADLAQFASARVTHRVGFQPAATGTFEGWAAPHVTLCTEVQDIAWCAKLIDKASATIMKDRAFRDELLSWMRMRRSAKGYHSDGLNKDALGMDAITAYLTRPILGTSLYDLFAALGLGPSLSGEAGRSKAASAIALFHWHKNGSMIDAGRAFYRTWLEGTAKGLAGWPAAALADDPTAKAAISAKFDIPNDRVLFNAIRFGVAKRQTPNRTRLSVADVIISP